MLGEIALSDAIEMRFDGTRDHRSRNALLEHGFDQCEMFEIVMGVEQELSGAQLSEDTADGPHIGRVGPGEAEQDLRSSVLSSADHSRVVVVLKGCAAEIDQSHHIAAGLSVIFGWLLIVQLHEYVGLMLRGKKI